MSYTLGEAAKAAGKSKTTIKRALDKGRISGKKNEIGEWEIEPVELHRVYPKIEPGTVTAGIPDSTPSNGALQARLDAAEREAALLREQHDRERRQLESTIEDLRADRDQWRQQATALLPDQREKETRQPPAAGRIARAWAALTGKG